MPPLVKGPETKLPLPRLRPDLVISEQKQQDRTYFILKDPISLAYLRLARHEYFIVKMLDGKRNIEDIAKLLQEKFAEAEFDAERAPQEVLQFLQQLSDKNFLLLPPSSAVETVLERKRDKWKRLFQTIRRNIFYIRLPIFDPDRLLTKMHPYLRFIWTRWFMFASLVLMLLAIGVVALHFDKLMAMPTDFFTPWNIALFWIAFIGVKVIHEFGHGLTAKNFGGEVHQMGVLFLAFTPALYCDTTDAWMMPKRMHKIWVSSAGIYVELIIASLAAFVWAGTNPGIVNQLALILMFLCSFSTIVFNANPLLKFDGYYMLSDALEIPNMQQKGYAYVMHLLRRWLFGERKESAQFSQTPLPHKYRGLFATYSITSYAYRWFILFAIFIFLSNLLRPYGLEALAKMFALFSVFSSMLLPIAVSGYYFFKARQTKPDPEPLTRPLIVCMAVLMLTFLAMAVPVPQNVERACVLKPREGFVRAAAPGFLRDVRVKDGDTVQKGDVLAVLENHELETVAKQLELEINVADIRNSASFASNDLSGHKKSLAERAQAEASLKKVRADLAALILRAPTDGMVQGFMLQDLKGRRMEAGQAFCQVAPTQPLRVVIPLDQREARLVAKDFQVKLRVYGHVSETFWGKVSRPPLALLRESRPELTANQGGDVPTQTDPRGVERPSESLYEAELEIDNPDGSLRPGMRGRAKVFCGSTTVAGMILQGLRNLIIFDLQV